MRDTEDLEDFSLNVVLISDTALSMRASAQKCPILKQITQYEHRARLTAYERRAAETVIPEIVGRRIAA